MSQNFEIGSTKNCIVGSPEDAPVSSVNSSLGFHHVPVSQSHSHTTNDSIKSHRINEMNSDKVDSTVCGSRHSNSSGKEHPSYLLVPSKSHVTKNVPRTRDAHGKYIPGSNAVYLPTQRKALVSTPCTQSQQEPTERVGSTVGGITVSGSTSNTLLASQNHKFRDSVYYGNREQIEQHLTDGGSEGRHIQAHRKEELENKRLQRKGRGYESYSYSLSVPLSGEDLCIWLPNEKSFQAVHVESAVIDVTECGKTSSNEIRFTEGYLVDCAETRLAIGTCLCLARTFTPIISFSFIGETVITATYEFPDQTKERVAQLCGAKQLRVLAPNHQICLDNGICKIVYLLESKRYHPLEIQFVPFIVDQILDDESLVLTPCKQPASLGDRCVKHFSVCIPTDFCPDTLLVLPPLDPCDISCLINKCLEEVCINWDCRAKEYIIEQTCSSGKVDAKTGSCSRRTMRLPKLFPGEAEFFVGKITPKRYCTASELACEIQRSMNPPFITEYSNTLTVNAVQVCLQVGEYSSPADLAFEIQTKVNFALNWTGTFVELSVCYEPESGRFLFSRVAPFMLEFQCTDSQLPFLLGFSDYLLTGNSRYVSNFQVYYVNKENSPISSCDTVIPSNRYLASYDQCNDLISIKAVSKADYTRLLLLSPDPPCNYVFCPGNNFVLPFRFLCDSPLTTDLEFVQKGEMSLEWISAVGVSYLIKPPQFLYLKIDQVEGDVLVTRCPDDEAWCCCKKRQSTLRLTCGNGQNTKTGNSSSCCDFAGNSSKTTIVEKYSALLQLNDCGNKYSTFCLQGDERTACRNLNRDNINKLSVAFFDWRGRQYNTCGQRILVNLAVCV